MSTRMGKTAWLFITDKSMTSVSLESPPQELIGALVFNSEQKVAYSKRGNNLHFDLTNTDYAGPVIVIELQFDKEVQMGNMPANK